MKSFLSTLPNWPARFVGLAALVCLTGCQSKPVVMEVDANPAPSGGETPRIAIATAYAPEFAALIPELKNAAEYKINGVSYWTGEMQGEDVILFETGVSLVNATMTTERLLRRFDVSAIIVSGVAGGLDPSLSIGDVTVPARWAQYNESVYMRETAPGEYKPHAGVEPEMPAFDFIGTRGVRISRPGDSDPERKIWFDATPDLLALADTVASSAKLKQCDDHGLCLPEAPEVVVGGNGVTGSIFMDNARFRDYLHTTFDAQVAEMETAAIAMVAYSNDVPFIAFRSLSDLAGGGQAEENEITAFQHLAAENSAAVVLAFLDAYGSAQGARPQAFTQKDYCEINFSAASKAAGLSLGEPKAAQLMGMLSDDTAHKAFLATQIQRAEDIAQLVAPSSKALSDPVVLEVWGGWKGRTSPSLAMRLASDEPDDLDTAAAIASAFGYVFMQEGVIAHCPVYDDQSADLSAFHLIEHGQYDLLSVDSLESVFGMMLGQADGNFDLGYTYYPVEDRFYTLGNTDGGAFEAEAMSDLLDTLDRMSSGHNDLSLSETGRKVAWLGNDWAAMPDGHGYLANPAVAEHKLALDSLRAEFLADLSDLAATAQ
ncbi:5'-methylthioadenosine/S-adenosylhomocysteine nucleosidase [Henriciella sp. AS95]|uniref:5'-methylthioadenosine/S-adenosylhomocysteine nucleosidase n=1 Tax=Henriciella sp. AS95 TaxID=3135782 RepID=UPI00316D89F7